MICKYSHLRIICSDNGFAGLFSVSRSGEEDKLLMETESKYVGRGYHCLNCGQVWQGNDLAYFETVQAHLGSSPWFEVEDDEVTDLSSPKIRPTIKAQLGVFND